MRKKLFWIVIVFTVSASLFYQLRWLSEAEGGLDKAVSAEEVNPSLGAPQNLKLLIVLEGFKLTWKPSSKDTGSVTGYEILRSANIASGPFTIIGSVQKGVFEYTDKTALPENIYYYKVRAVAGKEYSPYSNTVTGER